MDIRSYFTSASKKPPSQSQPQAASKEKPKPKSRKCNVLTISDDEDVIPESPSGNPKQKDIKKRARTSSDSDDSDKFVSNKTAKSNTATKPGGKTDTKLQQKDKQPNVKKPQLKEVSAADIFGNTPVNRTSIENKKTDAGKSRNDTIKGTEVGIHTDDGFDKTLQQLDEDGTQSSKNKSKETHNKNSDKIKTPIKKDSKEHKSDSKTSYKDTESSSKSLDRKIKDKNEKQEDRKGNEKNSKKHTNSNEKKDRSRDSFKESSPDKINKELFELPSKNLDTSHDTTKEKSKNHKAAANKSDAGKDETDFIKGNTSRMSFLDRKKALAEKLHGKKDFSMFINDDNIVKNNGSSSQIDVDLDSSVIAESPMREAHDVNNISTSNSESKSKKRKNANTSVSEVTDEERMEKKRYSALLYKSYLNRSGPKHPGAKEIPEGSPHCLSGLVFLTTGVLDSLEKDEVNEIVKKYGGDFKTSLSGKVTHLICGEDAGPAKIAKAEKMGMTMLSEDEFLDLIRLKSKGKTESEKASVKTEPTSEKKRKHPPTESEGESSGGKKSKLDSSKLEKYSRSGFHKEAKRIHKIEVKIEDGKKEVKPDVKSKYFGGEKDTKQVKQEIIVKQEVAKQEEVAKQDEIAKQDEVAKQEEVVKREKNIKVKNEAVPEMKKLAVSVAPDVNSIPWVEKYKPQTLKQIIGQHGDSSNVAKLISWLSEWYSNRKLNLPKPNPWAKDNKGGYYKAALLSGPPGVGKTTTVALVCKELGFDTVEFNASDTRSKTLLKEHLTDLVSSNSLSGYVHGKVGKGAVTKKHVVIMDEVDGMAGNEDRGGMQELLGLIKTTSVPIICMCNDKASQKMRSLTNNCFDLTFSRPKVEQIKAAMMSICYKEGIKILPQALQQMIIGTNQDIRQILNLLSVWSAADKNLTANNVDRDSKMSQKDMKLGPWEVVRRVFSSEDHKNMSIHDKSDLFFHDYSLGPLFVQQNYLKVVPKCPKKDVLKRFAEAADCISGGDLVDSKIRGNMAWSLLPLQAMYSSVLPGQLLSGHIQGQIDFPSWLGQNSKTNKLNRMAQELHSHTALSTTGSKLAIRLDYATHIRDAVINPLKSRGADGVHDALDVLQTYHLLREDLDSLLELSQWSGRKDPYAMVESKVKAALTRAYNKEATPLPYSQISLKKSRSNLSGAMDTDSEFISSETTSQETIDEEEVDDNSDLENDAMIKKPSKPSASSSKAKATSSKETKGKGKGGGKGKGKAK